MMVITKELLDKRICDIEEGANNPETYRDFIKNSEKEFEMEPQDLNGMDDEELNKYLEFIDYLWTK